VKQQNTLASSGISANIEKLESFAADLNSFFERGRKLTLFKKLPLRDERDEETKRLSEGRYLLRPCGVKLSENECNQLSIELLELLKEHLVDRLEDISAIADVFIKEKISSQNILFKIFKNEGNEIRKEILKHNLPEDLFTFFAIYLARPFREKAALYLMKGIDKLNWFNGYCPVCGHWPGLGHIETEEGHRTLWCLCCNTKWNFKRIQCAYCLNEKHEFLEILNPENEESYRIQGCKKCKRYLKEVRSNLKVENFPFDKVYLGTLPLDLIAKQEGYIQESMLTVRYEDPDGNELLMYRQKELEEIKS
jgi:formate dehydrogenase maturation protein FdhE